ncbi:MAG TPA: Wzz/FepE/Etk N-terminal domain-containing protein [Candidatus Acidoferrum sp.]|nr:Wzz/FepE/Etk N-terminal domain-containing protein [Candidatus Acidoferrum sp.]
MVARRELTPTDYLGMLQQRWRLIIALAMLGTVVGFMLSVVLPKRFTSQTLVLVDKPAVPRTVVDAMPVDDVDQRLAAMQSQILSRTRLEPIINQYGLYQNERKSHAMEDLVVRLRKAITITPIHPMDETRTNSLPGFTVAVTFDNAQLAQAICSSITSMFLQQNLELQTQQAEVTSAFLDKQLADAKAALDSQDEKLAAFKSRYLGSLPDQEQTNLNLLMELSSQLDANTQALSRAQQDKAFAESQLTQQLYAWQQSQTGQNPDTLEQQLEQLQSQLTSLKAQYTDDYPDVVKTKNDIEALKKKIADAESDKNSSVKGSPKAAVEPPQIQQLRAQIHQYDVTISERSAQQKQVQGQISTYEARVQSSPAVEQQYKELTRDHQTALDFYNDLLKKHDDQQMAVDLQRRQEGEQFRVLDPANLPDQPSFPNKLFFTAGGFGGGFALGLGLTLLLEMKDISIKNDVDVEHYLQLPVLAMVPLVEPISVASGRPPDSTRLRESLIHEERTR